MSEQPNRTVQGWDRFWFRPTEVYPIARLRAAFCLLTAIYFVSAWSDASFWYAEDGVFSPSNVSRFWQTTGLSDETKWSLSPLFLSESGWAYHAYLLVGLALSGLVAAGIGGRTTAFALWACLVGWANRAMILSGLTETLLSLALFTVAIAPPAGIRREHERKAWSARLSERLLAVQITLIGVVTTLTMLGGRVWFNGVGAYAMAAPGQDRTINWTKEGSLLVEPFVHESLTHFLVAALPVGLALAWRAKTSPIGKGVVITWCVAVALLGSHWLYAATFAVMTLTIQPDNEN